MSLQKDTWAICDLMYVPNEYIPYARVYAMVSDT